MDTQTLQRNDEIDRECPVCHAEMYLPMTIPDCDHTFCLLCLKGVYFQHMGGCPICRGPIDPKIFDKPRNRNLDLKMDAPASPAPPPKKARAITPGQDVASSSDPNAVVVKTEVEDVKPDVDALNAAAAEAAEAQPAPKYYWLYEGRKRGWWRFDPRLEKDISDSYASDMPITELIICGKTYIIDLMQMIQYPKQEGINYKRNIRRVDSEEFDTLQVKGLSGMLQ